MRSALKCLQGAAARGDERSATPAATNEARRPRRRTKRDARGDERCRVGGTSVPTTARSGNAVGTEVPTECCRPRRRTMPCRRDFSPDPKPAPALCIPAQRPRQQPVSRGSMAAKSSRWISTRRPVPAPALRRLSMRLGGALSGGSHVGAPAGITHRCSPAGPKWRASRRCDRTGRASGNSAAADRAWRSRRGRGSGRRQDPCARRTRWSR